MPDILETDVPLSQSLIWRRQREFYQQRGLKVWTEDRIPEYITNNPFIAEIYVRIVFNFLTECMEKEQPVSKDRPLRILELGAGHGKFCYLFLKQLMKLFPDAPVSYCMTDCSEASLEAWRNNPYLGEFVRSGVLEFELLQAGEKLPDAVSSKLSGGPLVVIASYVFDSLPQDAFIVQDGRLFEMLVTVHATGSKAQLSDLELSYRNIDVPPDRYSDETWNRILQEYRARLDAATLPFPCEALKLLRELAALSDGRTLVLVADKGFAHEEDLRFSQGPPALEFHGSGCFSQMVNLDAIGKYFRAKGGEALLPDKHLTSLSICGFLQGSAGDDFSKTKEAYRQSQEAFGPDDLFPLFAWLNAHMEEMSVRQMLAALRLTRWDPLAFMRLFPVLARQLRSVSTERQELRNAVAHIWENHYPLNAAENQLAFQCGVVLLELQYFGDAMGMFRKSEQSTGRSAPTSYNLGLCAIGMGRNSESLQFMIEACELDHNFEPARLSRARLEAEINKR